MLRLLGLKPKRLKDVWAFVTQVQWSKNKSCCSFCGSSRNVIKLFVAFVA